MNRSLAPIVAAGAAVALLAGCSGGTTTEPEQTGVDGVTTIKVGVSPSMISASTYLAEAKGYFDEAGLDVQLESLQAGSDAIPQLLNGGLDLAINDVAGTVAASNNGIEVVITSIATVSPTVPEKDYSAVVALDPAIQSPKDLEGRTVATNQLKGVPQLTVVGAVNANGGDASRINFVELPFPSAVDAIVAGQADAAMLPEPFLTQALEAGLHEVIRPQAYAVAGLPSTVFTASRAYAEANPEVIAAFNEALAKAAKLGNGDPQELRDATTYTQMPPELIAKVTYPQYSEQPDHLNGVGDLAQTMIDAGYLDQQPDLGKLLFDSKG